MSAIQTETVQLVEDSRQALQSIRRALIELYGIVGANPETPQDVSRQYGINRNLTWKLSRVINAPDPFETLNYLPGQQGMELAIKAFEKAGAPEDVLEPVRAAMARLEEVMIEHAGDREHLELTLESMGIFERDTTVESGRELAYRGNSMIWGVQAQTRWAGSFFGPGASPDLTDLVLVAGIVGFRRLRPNVQWKLHSVRLYDDKGGMLRPDLRVEEIELNKGPDDVPLQIREFCTPNTPDLLVRNVPGGREIILPGGPVGNRGTFDIFTGGIHRGLPRYRTPEETTGSNATSVTLPSQTLIFDLLMHRDLELPTAPKVALCGYPHGKIEDSRSQQDLHVLPMNEEVFELAGSPPAVSTPAVPRITKMVERVFARMGWKADEFRGVRLQMKYPPMGSALMVEWPLPERPE